MDKFLPNRHEVDTTSLDNDLKGLKKRNSSEHLAINRTPEDDIAIAQVINEIESELKNEKGTLLIDSQILFVATLGLIMGIGCALFYKLYVIG